MTDTSRGTLVRMALDVLSDLTTEPPMLDVSWPDFPLWTAALEVDEVTCKLRLDGCVDVMASTSVPGWGFLVVSTVVFAVRDMELPPVETGRTGRLRVTELDRCVPPAKAVA